MTGSKVVSQYVETRKVERSVKVNWTHGEQECLERIEQAIGQENVLHGYATPLMTQFVFIASF